MRRIAILLWTGTVASMVLAGPALAADDTSQGAQTVAMEAVALPVIVNGQLINYVFVSIRLDLTPKADGATVRTKEQFFRDDLVRMGHRTPFTRLDDYTKIDDTKVKAEVQRFAATLLGPGMIRSVVITKEMSQKMLTLPGVGQSRRPDIVP